MSTSDKKILIIDDDARNIFALSAVLRSRGFVCIAAASAEEGIAIIADRNDLMAILIDMMMPDMDGYTAIPVIMQMENAAGLPIIAVTAQAMKGDKEKCLQAGATAYVSKPVDIDELMEAINL